MWYEKLSPFEILKIKNMAVEGIKSDCNIFKTEFKQNNVATRDEGWFKSKQ